MTAHWECDEANDKYVLVLVSILLDFLHVEVTSVSRYRDLDGLEPTSIRTLDTFDLHTLVFGTL